MPALLDPVELTRSLIAIPSESSNPLQTDAREPEKGVEQKLHALFTAAGVQCSLQEVLPGRRNLVARFPRPGAPRIMITGHMDTVSAREERHGFTPVERDGKIFGRGACDDKGPLAAALCAILDENGSRTHDLTFLATVGEEVGMPGAKAYAEANAGKERYDLILGLEPTGLRPVTAHKGIFRFRVTTHGKSCHSSAPENGINAINRMQPILQALDAFGVSLTGHRCPRTGSATLAVTQISGGRGANIIPDGCEICVDVRTVPGGLSDLEIEKTVAALLGEGNVEIEPFLTHPPLSCNPAGAVWTGFAEALQQAGLDSTQTAVKYGTDCAYLQALGPCVVWGPGDIAQAHTENEFIDLSSLRQAVSVLSAWLR